MPFAGDSLEDAAGRVAAVVAYCLAVESFVVVEVGSQIGESVAGAQMAAAVSCSAEQEKAQPDPDLAAFAVERDLEAARASPCAPSHLLAVGHYSAASTWFVVASCPVQVVADVLHWAFAAVGFPPAVLECSTDVAYHVADLGPTHHWHSASSSIPTHFARLASHSCTSQAPAGSAVGCPGRYAVAG